MRRDFTSLVPTYKLAGDITHLCPGEGRRLYLSPVIDPNTRMVAGWSLSERMTESEMHCRRSFSTRDSAKHAVIELIEACCNRRRPHSTIGCKVPAEAMAAFFERTEPESEPEPVPMAA